MPMKLKSFSGLVKMLNETKNNALYLGDLSQSKMIPGIKLNCAILTNRKSAYDLACSFIEKICCERFFKLDENNTVGNGHNTALKTVSCLKHYTIHSMQSMFIDHNLNTLQAVEDIRVSAETARSRHLSVWKASVERLVCSGHWAACDKGPIHDYIPWICYERNFSEFYLSIWNQLVFNQRLQLFVQSPQPYLLFFAWWK